MTAGEPRSLARAAGAAAAVVAMALLAALAWAGPHGAARVEAERAAPAPSAAAPDPRATTASWIASAESGDAAAQVALGKACLVGTPAIAKDAARAREWFTRAAAAGSPAAAYYLGVTSQSGEGTTADSAAAARWLEIAANGGSAHAMFLLGNAYRAGAGVAANPTKALALYERAGEIGHPAALQALAMAYRYGELGLEPDEIESRRYAMEAEHALDHPPALP